VAGVALAKQPSLMSRGTSCICQTQNMHSSLQVCGAEGCARQCMLTCCFTATLPEL
jgi:hypothetical protein